MFLHTLLSCLPSYDIVECASKTFGATTEPTPEIKFEIRVALFAGRATIIPVNPQGGAMP